MSERRVKPGETLAMSSSRLHQDRKGFFWMMGSAPLANERCGDTMIVHVRGELEHHKEEHSCAESYEGILEKFRWAYEGQTDGDQDADDAGGTPSAIILCIDSPGGVVSGLNECVRELQRMRSEHPEVKVTCYVNEMATSAAYALACSCDEIVCPPSAILGSIGVISTMISQAARDKKEGFDVRLLTSGARKADGHLHAPITDQAVSVETKRVEKLAKAFFQLVSKARGISPKKLEALQAGIYLGKDAIRVGLADRLMAYADLLAGAQTNTNTPASAGGNQTDRRLNMNLTSLIKKTKAALAATDDPKKIRTLSEALATYSASLEAYKKTEKHIEHVKTEEAADEDEEDEEDEEEESAKSSEEEEAKASTAKKSEEEAVAKSDDSDDDDDDDDDEDEAKSAKKALALVKSITGMTGKKAHGALQAMAHMSQKAIADAADVKRELTAQKKATLIADAVRGSYITKADAKYLESQPFKVVAGWVEHARSRGKLVSTDDSTLLKPKAGKPGTEESLPEFTRKMIDEAVASADPAKREKLRAELVAANLKVHNEQISRALNGTVDGRY